MCFCNQCTGGALNTCCISYSEIWQKCTSLRPQAGHFWSTSQAHTGITEGPGVSSSHSSLEPCCKQKARRKYSKWWVNHKKEGQRDKKPSIPGVQDLARKERCKSDLIPLPGITYFALCGPCGDIKGALGDLGFKQTVRMLSMVIILKQSSCLTFEEWVSQQQKQTCSVSTNQPKINSKANNIFFPLLVHCSHEHCITMLYPIPSNILLSFGLRFWHLI